MLKLSIININIINPAAMHHVDRFFDVDFLLYKQSHKLIINKT
jgi:hypothetical protein